MHDKISVIIPVYNVEKYIDRCLTSIVKQSYDNLEIILVDDGSTDGSGEICDRYAKDYDNIKVVHQKNGGLSAARNSGINASSGEFYAFVDSDDYIHCDYFKVLYDNMLQFEDVDISITGYQRFENEVISEFSINQAKRYSSQEALERIAKDARWVISCGKLFRKELFRDIEFKIGKIHEDEFIIHHLYYRARAVSYTDTPLYFYYMNSHGITGSVFSSKKLDIFDALKDRLELYRSAKLDYLFMITVKEILLRYNELYYQAYLCSGHEAEMDIMEKEYSEYLSKYKKVYKLSIVQNPELYTIQYKKMRSILLLWGRVIRRIKK